MPERRFLLALGASLLLHLAFLGQPLWRLPMQGEAATSPRLDARLLAVPRPEAKAPRPRKPRPQKAAPRPASAPAQPTETPPLPAQALEPRPGPAVARDAPAPPSPPDVPAEAEAEPVPAAPGLPISDILASADEGRLVFNVIFGRQGLIVGRATQTWKREGGRYTLASVTETVGLAALFKNVRVTQVSSGRISGKGLVPEAFRVVQDDGAIGSARFDWKKMRIFLDSAGEKRDVPLDAGAQDLLSFIYQLVIMRPEGNRALHVATGKGYNTYVLEYKGEEKLPIAGSQVASRHYITVGPPGEQTTEVWLASDLAFLPVRVRFTDRKGQTFDMIAMNLDFGPIQRQNAPRSPMDTP
ncbi:MAG: DUF3108 domain-containing protein [Rhodocyclaceae bacterium]|nr:DUF3108 domain-containing protein [Rhodocyclaceae bacterium]